MAKMIIEENEKLIGQEVAEKAKDKIEKETKGRKGGKEDERIIRNFKGITPGCRL